MVSRKKVITFAAFMIMLIFMTTFAGGTPQNAPIATRNVTFMDKNNEVIAVRETEVGGSVVVPEYDEYLFLGWFDASGKQITDFTNVLSNMTVYARYSEEVLADEEEQTNPNPNVTANNNGRGPSYRVIPGEEGYQVWWNGRSVAGFTLGVVKSTPKEDEECSVDCEVDIPKTLTLKGLNWNNGEGNGDGGGIISFVVAGVTLRNNVNHVTPEVFASIIKAGKYSINELYTVIDRSVTGEYEKTYDIRVALYRNGQWIIYSGTIVVDNPGGNNDNQKIKLTLED